MTGSHESLRDLYECSHPQLDKLVELSKGAAYGARLTGAGWGGCIVALVEPDKTEKYIQMLKNDFYRNETCTDNLIFATSPQAGASVYIH